MKNTILILLIFAGVSLRAQTFPAYTTNVTKSATRGTGGVTVAGSYLPIGYSQSVTTYVITGGVVTPTTRPDTMQSPGQTNGGYDSTIGYAQFSYNSRVTKGFDLSIKSLTGTLAGTAILQGSYDGQTWYTITGNTTYATGSVGASATLTGSGTTHYQWFLPLDADVYPIHQIKLTATGTCTFTYSLTPYVAY